MDDPMDHDKWTFKCNTTYEFTINFNDSYQLKGQQLITRYDNARKHLRKELDEYHITYKLMPEISMPQYADNSHNTYPRIHFHGIISFNSNTQILQFLLDTSIKLAKMGRYQFNDYRPQYWPQYCLKHKDLFSNLTSYELESKYNMEWPAA